MHHGHLISSALGMGNRKVHAGMVAVVKDVLDRVADGGKALKYTQHKLPKEI